MIIEGVSFHNKCGGTGILEEANGKTVICEECMGSGMIEGEVEIDG